MKEKEVRLTVEEINYLLKGSILWDDIEPRVEAPLRKPIEPKKDPLEKAVFAETLLDEPRLKDFREKDPELAEVLQTHEITGFSKPFLEGNKVYWVLSTVILITLGTWAYFVFAR